MAVTQKSSAGKILHNSYWFGLESIVEAVVLLGTSVAVARALGPAKLGYFSYINFFVAIITRTSGTGLSTATRKYMSEFIALDRLGTARAVYVLAHRYQLMGAIAISAVGLAGIELFGDPRFRLMSSILILSIIPGVMSWVPAQANSAFEDVRKNTISAFGYLASYLVVIVLALRFHWDLVGVASALLVGRTVEVIWRTIPVERMLRQYPLEPLDSDVVRRIRRFCIQAMGLQLLMSVVWDRSELVFLRHYSNLVQMAFYSISFGLANNLQTLPRIFGASTGITLMVEAVRDRNRVESIVGNASRYLLLIVLPVSLGAAAITLPALRIAYGVRYIGAAPVMVVAAVLGIPRAFQPVPEILMRTADKQNRILVWYGITGILNIAVDWVLIPHYGAVGAAWGNGLAQAFGTVAIWFQAQRTYRFRLPMGSTIRLTLASCVMAVVAYFISRRFPSLLGLVMTVGIAAVVYILMVRLFRGLQASDRGRLAPVGDRLPGPMRRLYLATIAFVTPANA